MMTYMRKQDDAMLWPQQPPLIRAMDTSRHLGGRLYWLQGDHTEGEEPWTVFPEWKSEDDWWADMFKYRTNQSYPAFSNCNINENPGNGEENNGDPRGGYNRYFIWDTQSIKDEPTQWEMTVNLLPESPSATATADFTLRRLQKLVHKPGVTYNWVNKSVSDNTIIQSGQVTCDNYRLVTLKSVQFSKTGNRIIITASNDVPFNNNTKSGIELNQNYPNPFGRTTTIPFSLSVASRIKLDLLDCMGRVVATIANNEFPAGAHYILFSSNGLESGVYYYRITSSNETACRKLEIIK
jgi:hypothetical protein